MKFRKLHNETVFSKYFLVNKVSNEAKCSEVKCIKTYDKTLHTEDEENKVKWLAAYIIMYKKKTKEAVTGRGASGSYWLEFYKCGE